MSLFANKLLEIVSEFGKADGCTVNIKNNYIYIYLQ